MSRWNQFSDTKAFLTCFCRYYGDIQSMPVISDQDMNAMLAEHSQRHHLDFYTLSALNELYFGYACKYRSEVRKKWIHSLWK